MTMSGGRVVTIVTGGSPVDVDSEEEVVWDVVEGEVVEVERVVPWVVVDVGNGVPPVLVGTGIGVVDCPGVVPPGMPVMKMVEVTKIVVGASEPAAVTVTKTVLNLVLVTVWPLPTVVVVSTVMVDVLVTLPAAWRTTLTPKVKSCVSKAS